MYLPTTYDGTPHAFTSRRSCNPLTQPTGPIRIAVIGGTGIYSLEDSGFTPVARLSITTPWGAPSSPITIVTTPNTSAPIAFLSRHGTHHEITPTLVPNLANIAALRSIGVRTILAFSAVGSLQEHISLRDFVVPDQVIDRTKGVRPCTYFTNGVVGHVAFADPFSAGLRNAVIEVAKNIPEVKMHAKGTVIGMEGPQFSTRAESKMYRAWGGDVINMTVLPEAKLAREAELSYALVCMCTDCDCWKDGEAVVDLPAVIANMKANAENAKKLVAKVLERLAGEEFRVLVETELEGGSKWAVCTKMEAISEDAREKLMWLGIGGF